MKKEISKLASLFIVGIIMFSCEKTNDDVMDINTEAIKATATTGVWTVSLFEEDNINETSDFAGFNFTFNEDGSLLATNETVNITGAWSITKDDDDSKDDDSKNDSNDIDL